jgi:DNA-binding SARP family transcriptional activator
MQTPQFQIHLFGPPAIYWQEASITPTRRQARALLFCLADEMRPLSRAQLALLLWPENTETAASRNLTRLLSYTRKVLPHHDLLQVGRDAIFLDTGLAWSDTAHFTLLTGQADKGALAEAVNLYRGDFLSGFALPDNYEFDGWLAGRRWYYERGYLGVLAKLVTAEMATANYAEAIQYGRQYLATDNLSEEIHRQLITLYTLNGDRSAALQQFEQCTVILERELGVQPLPETRAAYDAARQDTGTAVVVLPAPKPTWRTLPGLSLPLVGREKAWQEVDAAYRRFSQGGVIFISGEPGVGKSRLMQTFAEAQEALLLVGHSNAQTLPYKPLAAALRLALARPELGRGVRPIWLAETARLLPELHDRFPDLPPPIDVEPQQGQARLFEALTQVFLSLAPGVKPLLCLDDVHWADEATLGWLQYATARLAGSGLVIIATYRAQMVDALHPWQRELGRAELMATVELDGLSPEAVTAVLRQVSGEMIDPERLAGRIHAATGGNAFFVLEVVRELLGTGRLATDEPDLPLPQSVQDAVLRRVGRLGPLAQQVSEMAAVLSPHLNFETMVDAAGRGEMEVAEALEALTGGQLLAEDAEKFHFHHDLAREAIYQNIRPWRRRLLHRRAAIALANWITQEDDDLAPVIATHFDKAGERMQAINYYRQAATKATALYAHQEAIGYLKRAIELANEEAAATAVLPQLHEALADNLAVAGEFAAAEGAYRVAMVLTPMDESLQLAALAYKLAATLTPQQRADEAEAIYRTALARIDKMPPMAVTRQWQTIWLNLLLGLLDILYFQIRPGAMAALNEQTRLLLDAVGTAEQQSQFYSRLNQMTFIQNRFRLGNESISRAQTSLVYARESGRTRLIARQQFHVGFCLLWSRKLDEAEKMLRQALAMAEASGDFWLQDQCLAYSTILYRLRGDITQVLAYLPKLVEVSNQVGNTIYIGVSQANRAWLHYRAGEWLQAQAQAKVALTSWTLGTGYPLQWLAHWLLLAMAQRQSQPADAVAAARAMLHPKQQQLPDEIDKVLEAAVAAWDAGDEVTAHTFLKTAVELATQHGYL